MTLLSVIQDVASDLGLKQPSAVFGSTDLTAQILLRFAQKGARELVTYHDWQALTVQKTFTTLNQVVQTNSLPAADYDRMAYNPEVWNRSLHLKYVGPTPQRTWQRLQAGVGFGIIGYWRILAGQLNIFPAPSAGQTLAYEYISKQHCTSAAGAPQSLFMADTDLFLLPEDLLKLEITWRFRASRGFAAYAEDLSTCEREKEKAASQDRGTGRIRVENNSGPGVPTWSGTIGSP
jgi:hypothetical protein